MNKSDLVSNIARKLDLPRHLVDRAVDSVFAAMVEGLSAGNRVEIRGFGSFAPREYAGYLGRNPATGEEVPVPPKVQPFFKAGKEIKNVLNK